MTQGNQGYGQQPGPYGENPGGQGGPSYASPQYGSGTYGQPAGGPGGGPAGAKKFGVTGFVIALVGAAAVVVSFLAPLNWGKQDKTSYSRIHDLLASAPSDQVETLAKLYFAWLGWALLAAAFVFAVIACLPSGASGALRGIGTIVGLGGAVVTLFAIKLGTDEGLTQYLKAGRLGYYLAIAGFVVVAIGALVGARKT